MSKRAKEYLKKHAWEKFPARELWIKRNNRFWAFDIRGDNIYSTEGVYINGNLSYVTDVINSTYIENEVESLISFFINEGYTCFAMELRE
jgi:hypothetical protein